MKPETGWIKLHRQITGWKWYGDANTVRVFLHLLLSCPPGEDSCRVSALELSRVLNLTRQEVRAALARLIADGTIRQTAHQAGRAGGQTVEIANWHKFQIRNQFKAVDNQGVTEYSQPVNAKNNQLNNQFKAVDNQGVTEYSQPIKQPPFFKEEFKERLEKTRAPAHTHVHEDSLEVPASPLTTGFPLPKNIADVKMVATARGILMTDEELQDFYDWHTARGWRDAHGFQFHDWRFLIRGWVAHRRKEQKNIGDNNGYNRSIRQNGGQIGQNFSGTDYGEADEYAPLPDI